MDRSPHPVTLDGRTVEGLGHDSLTGEGGVAVQEDRKDGEPVRVVDAILHGSHHAFHHRVDGLQVAGVGRQLELDLVAGAADEGAGLTEVVLDVTRSLGGVGVDEALELPEQLVVALAHDVGEHVEATAVGHSHHRRVEAVVGRGGQDGVKDRDGRLCAFYAEALLADVLGGQELLERFGCVEAPQDVALLVGVDAAGDALDLLLDPALLSRVGNVHVLDAHRAAVGVAQHVEQAPELHPGPARHTAAKELPVQVPDGQPVGGRVQLGVHHRFLPSQRIQIGDEVTPDPVLADQRLHVHLLFQPALFTIDGVVVDPPLHRLVGNPQRVEHVVVEAVPAHQQVLHPLEEQARLRPLDDAVVIGGGDGHHLGHTELGQGGLVGAAERGRIVETSHPHDHALPRHQPRHRLDGPDGSGVGEGDGGPGEVVGGELVVADLADQVLVGPPESPEVQDVGVFDHRDQQGARAAGLLDVDRQTQPDPRVADDPGLSVGAFQVAAVHHRDGVGGGPHDRVTDQVGEADLSASGAAEVAVDDPPVYLQQLGRNLPKRRRGGYRQTGLHVGDDPRRRSPERLTGDLHRSVGGDTRRRRRTGRGCTGCGGADRRHLAGVSDPSGGRKRHIGGGGNHVSVALVVGEEVPPALAHRGGVGEVLLVHLVDQPRVGAKDFGGAGAFGHRTRS